MFKKSLLPGQSVDKVSELFQIAYVAWAVATFRFPSDYNVGHFGRSLHASYEATGTSAQYLFSNVFPCLLLEGCGFLKNSC